MRDWKMPLALTCALVGLSTGALAPTRSVAAATGTAAVSRTAAAGTTRRAAPTAAATRVATAAAGPATATSTAELVVLGGGTVITPPKKPDKLPPRVVPVDPLPGQRDDGHTGGRTIAPTPTAVRTGVIRGALPQTGEATALGVTAAGLVGLLGLGLWWRRRREETADDTLD
ncbi:LPXTG cell wall anchor domain-containing protein [Lacticaseibacillus kribbianus]|uniref:LPXTG cell wall anchor domain-containing protein n=1 Tax=Lacticaseibacillus kribbianus TaxID=2926292 RepID=UPI001CD5DA2E|nr:LPXTG cell wall anchor domain-containing protein [Lacticaseibacillus kribbianus]